MVVCSRRGAKHFNGSESSSECVTTCVFCWRRYVVGDKGVPDQWCWTIFCRVLKQRLEGRQLAQNPVKLLGRGWRLSLQIRQNCVHDKGCEVFVCRLVVHDLCQNDRLVQPHALVSYIVAVCVQLHYANGDCERVVATIRTRA